MPTDGSVSNSSIQITRKSRSNLAIALSCLPGERKKDMISFYAFCRVLDDIADDPEVSISARQAEMDRWRAGLLVEDKSIHPVMAEVLDLAVKYGFDRGLLVEILDGMASDLVCDRYATFTDLLAYCYKVASAVGLVSIEIFGYKNPRCKEYAVNLGYALQLTNIIRDVGQDARESGRVYLSADLMAAYGVTEQQILDGSYDERFRRLMEDMYQRAVSYFEKTEALLPPEDRGSMIAAEMMAQVYREILEKVRKGEFRVFDTRVRLHTVRKLWILGSFFAKKFLNFR